MPFSTQKPENYAQRNIYGRNSESDKRFQDYFPLYVAFGRLKNDIFLLK